MPMFTAGTGMGTSCAFSAASVAASCANEAVCAALLEKVGAAGSLDVKSRVEGGLVAGESPR